MRKILVLAIFIAVGAAMYWVTKKSLQQPEESSVDRGRYLVQVSGCNDCHTKGYAEAGGKIDEKDWLMGDTLGWQGPWGTTYAINLRLYVQAITEEQWLQIARRIQSRPPMPYYILQQMNDEDLRAIYRYIRGFKHAGQPAPVYLPPGVEATTPVFKLVLPGNR